jgi:hypothetical protein
MHEDLSRTEEVKGSSDRSFGLVMAAFFALMAFSPLLHKANTGVRWWALVPAAAFLVLALLWQRPLRPLNWLWLQFGLLLYKLVSPVALGILFYLAVAPTGLLMRALGKDPLHLKRDPAAPSYWIMRAPPGPTPESMKNQF